MGNALKGKTALVTGGGTGFGRSAAGLLAGEGAQVIITGRRQAVLDQAVADIMAEGGAVVARAMDMEKPDDVRALAAFALEQFGCVDVLVNNAGHSSKVRSVRWISEEEWDSVFNVNVKGIAILTQALLPAMLEAGAGTIITVSSMAAVSGGLLGGAAYGPAKAAVVNYMNTLSSELRNRNIRTISILPAEADTPILGNRPLMPDAEARATMMGAEDIGQVILLAATLPQRTMLDQIIMSPTIRRDVSADLEAARVLGAPEGVE